MEIAELTPYTCTDLGISRFFHGIDQRFCPIPAVAFEAFQPPFVYKLGCPLHPLGPSVFVLSIQLIRLVGFPNIINTCKIFGLPLAVATIGDTTPASTVSASASASATTLNIMFSNFVSTLNNTS